MRISLSLISAFSIACLMGFLGSGTLWYIILILFLTLTAILNQRPDLGPKLKTVVCLALLLANVDVPLAAYGMARGKILSNRGPELAQARALHSTPEHTVLLDHCVARYVFGYRIPAGFLDLNFSAPFPNHFATDNMHPGDIYLASPAGIDALEEITMLNLPAQTWLPFGLPNRKFYVEPRRVHVIPSDECRVMRAR